MSYVTLAELKTYLRNELPSADDADLQQALDSADTIINRYCGRTFTVASTASPRTYAPTGADRDVLRIHDATTITAVTENGTALTAATTYQTEPVQSITWTGETWPYEQLRRLEADAWYTSGGTGTVVVTGTWGWAAVPAAVKQAAKILAKDIALHRDVRFGLVGATEFGGIRARQATIVGELLDSYRRAEARRSSRADVVRSDWGDATQLPTNWDSTWVNSWA